MLRFNNQEFDDLVFDQEGNYGRTNASWFKETGELVAQAYGQKESFLVSSGLQAIYITLKAIILEKKTGIILYSDEMYDGVDAKIIKLLSLEFPGIIFIKFMIDHPTDLFDRIRHYKDLIAIFMESASNPCSKMVDWEKLRFPNSVYLVIDNTWLTPVNFNPFYHRADIVVDSCSKYMSMGKCIGGSITFNQKLAKKFINSVSFILRASGAHVSPINALLIGAGMKNLSDTVEKISQRMGPVLDFLVKSANNRLIDMVIHPSLEDHPSNKLFKKWTNQKLVGTVYFNIPNPNLPKNWKYIIGDLISQTSIKWHTSYGKSYDLFCQFCYKDETSVWLRLSVGYEENAQLIPDLEKLCHQIREIK